MDIKTISKSGRRRPNVYGARRSRLVSDYTRSMLAFSGYLEAAMQPTVRQSQWEYGLLQSSTSGTIAAGNISPSIQNSTEYATMASIWNEVKLVAFKVTFTPKLQTVQNLTNDKLFIGTNFQFNNTTFTTPSGSSQVENLQQPAIICTYGTRPYTYYMKVPLLSYSIINADSPATPTPWAGSPGTVVVWADNLDITHNYMSVTCHAIWLLRGRV
jgi:hypothetical protein